MKVVISEWVVSIGYFKGMGHVARNGTNQSRTTLGKQHRPRRSMRHPRLAKLAGHWETVSKLISMTVQDAFVW